MLYAKQREEFKRVPSLWSHLVSNHDLLWTWQEELHVPPADRFPFCIRIVRLVLLQCLLLLTVALLIGNRGEYFFEECEKRSECMTGCNEDFFPGSDCASVNYAILYKGNTYRSLFSYPQFASPEFSTCSDYVSENPDYSEAESGRQERVHTCFTGCELATTETRENCSSDSELVCVSPKDDCEEVQLLLSVWDDHGFEFDLAYVLIAVPVANLLQYCLIYLFMVNWKVGEHYFGNLRKNSAKCLTQTLILTVSTAVFLGTCWRATLVHVYGPTGVLWRTFLVAFVVDQCKSVVFLLGVYYIFVRRMGEWKVNEAVFVDSEWAQHRKDTTLIKCRAGCGKLLEARRYEVISISFLLVYAVFVLIVLSASEQINADATLDLIDQAFLSVFLLEIAAKSFVHGYKYYFDFFNSFDALIVIGSFVMFFVGTASRGFALLRLLRLVRLVIVLRKVSASGKRKSKGFLTALEEGLAILHELGSVKKLSFRQKKDLKWVLGIISTNKLYEVTLAQQTDKTTGQVAQDTEARKWVSMATLSANDPLQWFDRDLDDYLYERHRENGVKDDQSMYQEELKSLVPLQERAHFELEKMFEGIGDWRFNAFQYAELTGPSIIAHFTIKLFQFYDIITKFEIPTVSLRQFSSSIYEGYSAANPYHNATHAIDVAHRMNYFILTGDLMRFISDLDIMASLIACIIHDYQHPSVSNEFLIRRGHQKAVRFNDTSVLERHHLASAFAVMLDQSCDITLNLTEDQYWVVRTAIIRMVLATDMKMQEQTLSAFKNSRGIENFPNNDGEKQVLLNLGIRIADYGNPLQPKDLYFKWMSLMMEEFYQQGDIEEHLGMEGRSPFMDRKESNPYLAQIAFIEVILEPMVHVWAEFLPGITEDIIVRGLTPNLQALRNKSENIPESFNKDFSDNNSEDSVSKEPLPLL